MAFKRGAKLLAGLFAMLVFAGSAAAGSAAMITTGITTQPVGHYEFCLREPQECAQRTASRRPVSLTRELWSAVQRVNREVNDEVIARTDAEIWGQEELWSYPEPYGDCEDYVLEKRRRLMALGIPAGSLLITVVRQPNGDGHAVLTVRTDRGDFVLDNIRTKVLDWRDTEYTFLKRQSETNSGQWVSINDGRAVAVGSLR